MQRTTDRTIDLTKEIVHGSARAERTDSVHDQLVGNALHGDHIYPMDAAGRVPSGSLLVKRLLGMGALGEVYEVCPSNAQRKRFALKVPRLPVEQNGSAIRNEIDKLGSLRGTHIPKLLQHGEIQFKGQRIPYYVTHLLQSIEESYPRFGKTGQLHPIRTLEVIYSLAQTLSTLAQKNVVHNDFKLENVMFFGRLPLLVDWGTAKFSSEINEIEAARRAGKLHGTPSWLPPELIKVEEVEGGRPRVLLDLDCISQFTDVYGLGLLLLLLLTGKQLFDGVPLGGGVLGMFLGIHQQFHERDLLGSYRQRCKRWLERQYLATDVLSHSQLQDNELLRLYDMSPTDRIPVAPLKKKTFWRRLTRSIRSTPPPPQPTRKLDGLTMRETLIENMLDLYDDCVSPIAADAQRRRLHATTLVAKMNRTWPGLPLWYAGQGYMALPALEL